MFKKEVEEDIKKFGHHTTFVIDGAEPRYAYTTGLYEAYDFELVFAGGLFFMKDDVIKIINDIISQFRTTNVPKECYVEPYGFFAINRIDESWSKLMLIGVFDYYDVNVVKAYQIIPNSKFFTLDIPQMSKVWNEVSQPIWKWLSVKWNYPVPENSKVTTNLNSLFGEKITEVMRWEDDEWEAFAGPGPDVNEEDVRIVSMGTMLGIDPTLEPIMSLKVGKGLWRDSIELSWKKWN